MCGFVGGEAVLGGAVSEGCAAAAGNGSGGVTTPLRLHWAGTEELLSSNRLQSLSFPSVRAVGAVPGCVDWCLA